MMARSKCSNQRPDTLMQDRSPPARRNHLQRTTGPYIRVKMRNTRKEQIISASPLSTDIIKHERHVGKVPITDIACAADFNFGNTAYRVRRTSRIYGRGTTARGRSCITLSGMFTSQLKPSGSNLSRASPCNWPGSACSISREPKLFREGSRTGGPPRSFQCSLNRSG